MGPVQVLTGSLIMGGGIAAMHYLGMAAMRLPAISRFSPFLVALSIVFAIGFSGSALLLAFDLRKQIQGTTLRKIGSALVMGVAISTMHYTGMGAATFVPSTLPPNLSHAVSISPLGNNGIGIVAFLVLGAAILTSSVDRQAEAEVRRINQQLEQRVVERTLQLEAVIQELRKEAVERKRAEEAVRRSLRLVIDTLPMLVWSKSPDGSADFLNHRFREYTGLSVEEGLGWGWMMNAFHPEDKLTGAMASSLCGRDSRSRKRHAFGGLTGHTDGSSCARRHCVTSREKLSNGMEQLLTSKIGSAPKMNCESRRRSSEDIR